MDQVLQVVLTGLSQGAIYALFGLGFSLVSMSTRVLNLAQGSYGLWGGFVFISCVSAFGMPPLLALALAVVATALLGVLTEYLVNLRSRPWRPINLDVAVLTTLALMIVFEGAAFLIWGADPQRGPSVQRGTFMLFGAVMVWQSVWMFAAMIVFAIGLHLFLHYTWMGQAMRACAQNPLAAHLLGINVRRVAMVTFGIAAMLGAVAGILVSPVTWLDYQIGGYFMLQGVLAFLLGGEEEIAGPVVGGIVLGLVENMLLLLPGGGVLKQVVPMLLLLAILLWRPQGLLAKRAA
jgi:branched-subunit amino acid ABC-type transport system permease component